MVAHLTKSLKNWNCSSNFAVFCLFNPYLELRWYWNLFFRTPHVVIPPVEQFPNIVWTTYKITKSPLNSTPVNNRLWHNYVNLIVLYTNRRAVSRWVQRTLFQRRTTICRRDTGRSRRLCALPWLHENGTMFLQRCFRKYSPFWRFSKVAHIMQIWPDVNKFA